MERGEKIRHGIIGVCVTVGFIIWDKYWYATGILFTVASVIMIADYIKEFFNDRRRDQRPRNRKRTL